MPRIMALVQFSLSHCWWPSGSTNCLHFYVGPQLLQKSTPLNSRKRRWQSFLLGRHFVIESNHQSLKTLLGRSNKILHMASSRIVRWAIFSAYNYTIKCKSGKWEWQCTQLRLPSPVTTPHDCVPADIACVIDHHSSTSTSAANNKGWTTKDPTLSCVHCFLLSGLPTQQLSKEFHAILCHEEEWAQHPR